MLLWRSDNLHFDDLLGKNFISNDFFELETLNRVPDDFSLIVGNPPFGSFKSGELKSEYAIQIESQLTKAKVREAIPQNEISLLFADRAMHHIQRDGLLCMILPSANTLYYQNAVGALLVYDVTIPETFEKVKSWVQTLQEAVGKDIIFVIAGNKFDLSKKNMLDANNANVDAYCKQENCQHFYTSAKTGYNVDEAFDCLITSVLKKLESSNTGGNRKGRGRKLDIKEQTKPKEKKKCC